MILSKTSEYAIRILTYMAVGERERYSAKYIHEQLKIPYKYLTKLMTDLAKRGCITSLQGRDGGFVINKELDRVSIADIVGAVEGPNRFDGCVLGFDECSDENPCAMHKFWEENKIRIIAMFKNTTLKDLISNTNLKY